jgi:hypothetical protein
MDRPEPPTGYHSRPCSPDLLCCVPGCLAQTVLAVYTDDGGITGVATCANQDHARKVYDLLD